MLELLPELTGPYFDFLIYPVDECWEWRRGKKQHSLKRECFHHPQSLRIQECIVSVYSKAFYNAAERFNYYGPTEYKRDELTNLHAFIAQSIEDLQRCSDSAAIQIMLPECFKSFLYEDLHLWLPDCCA